MSIQTRIVHYSHNGIDFEALMAWDDALTQPAPAVAIAHAWAGRGPLESAKAEALAELGYVGFALDVYGGGKRGSSIKENSALMKPLMENRSLLQARLGAGIEALQSQPEVDAQRCAAMGFCFGGLCALDLARIGAPLQGVISFHGLFAAPGNTSATRITAKVLVLHGYDDPMVPPAQILELAEELKSAGADWQLHAYGNTMHAFTNPSANDPDFGTVYNPVADLRSWQTAVNFFAELFA